MTEEEKAELERRRAAAKKRCGEVYGTITLLKKLLNNYYADYYRWKGRFEKADRALAEVEKLHKVSLIDRRKVPEPRLEVKLTKAQILSIAEELGVKVELDFDD